MKNLTIAIALMLLIPSMCLAAQIEISQETIDTLVKIGIDDPAAHLKNKADKYNNAESDREWNKLSVEQKKDKLKK